MLILKHKVCWSDSTPSLCSVIDRKSFESYVIEENRLLSTEKDREDLELYNLHDWRKLIFEEAQMYYGNDLLFCGCKIRRVTLDNF
jgi:hypothetical protein